MIRRMVPTALRGQLISPARPFLTSLRVRFSEDNRPRSKQEAWMMQEQKALKTDPFGDDVDEKTYPHITKIGIGAIATLSAALAYLYYFASQKSEENLDLIEEDISGLKELKAKESLIGGDWTLINADGQPFSSRNLAGYYYLIYFGYASCPDICPSTLYYLSSVYRIIRNLPEGAYLKLKLVFVSVDPERDTPKLLKKYLGEFGKNIIGVTGQGPDDIELKECMKKIYYNEGPKKGSYEIDHTTRVYLMTPENTYLDHLDATLTEQQNAKAIVAKIIQNEHMKEKAEERLTATSS